MDNVDALGELLEPLLTAFAPKSLLLAGELAIASVQSRQDTRSRQLTTPFRQQQLHDLQQVDVAVISDLTETMPVAHGQQWLGSLRNVFAPHVILISDPEKAQQQGWQFADFLALGLHHVAISDSGLHLYSYAIENYQPKRDWLNSRFWANPENFGKYWW
jgi:ABC-type transporter Mla MlaB component